MGLENLYARNQMARADAWVRRAEARRDSAVAFKYKATGVSRIFVKPRLEMSQDLLNQAGRRKGKLEARTLRAI